MCIRHTSAPDSATTAAIAGIPAQRRDVVHEHRAGAGGGARHRGLGGVDRQRDRAPLPRAARSPASPAAAPRRPAPARRRGAWTRRRRRRGPRPRRPCARHARPPRPGPGTRPPSENESGVTFSTPITAGRGNDGSTSKPRSASGPQGRGRSPRVRLATPSRRAGAVELSPRISAVPPARPGRGCGSGRGCATGRRALGLGRGRRRLLLGLRCSEDLVRGLAGQQSLELLALDRLVLEQQLARAGRARRGGRSRPDGRSGAPPRRSAGSRRRSRARSRPSSRRSR